MQLDKPFQPVTSVISASEPEDSSVRHTINCPYHIHPPYIPLRGGTYLDVCAMSKSEANRELVEQ